MVYRLLAVLAAFVLLGHTEGKKRPHRRAPACRKAANLHNIQASGGKKTLVQFGGRGFVWARKGKRRHLKKQTVFLGDTWTFDYSNPHLPDHGKLKKSDWSQPELVPNSAGDPLSPSPRWKMESTMINDDKTLVMFGGCSTQTAEGVNSELWVFEESMVHGNLKGHWRQVRTLNHPRPRRGHTVVSNETHLVVVGGKTWSDLVVANTQDQCIVDLWSIPLDALAPGREDGVWTQGASFPDSCRWGTTGSRLKHPTRGDVLAIFGGRALNPNASWHSTAPDAYWYYDDLWLYFFKENVWEKAEPKGVKPQKRDHHGADALNGDLFVFGGRMCEGREASCAASDIWSYSLDTNTWTEHSSSSGMMPTPRYMAAVAAAPWKGHPAIFVIGGESLLGDNISSTKKSSLNDVWVFVPGQRGGGAWEQLTESHCKWKSTGVGQPYPQGYAAPAELLAELSAPTFPSATVLLSAAVAVSLLGLVTARCRGGKDVQLLDTDDGPMYESMPNA
eukprot:TRINITY_DN60148_c0_g1_i1.p1 TRINITY_DN60148_c0_g1~~TRINITY_DN60148_c0_g1_i1.p1  ORF type:complete len:504 (-),score=62.33 TRINITY_DN60148_c0_g1_i1:131-1642(-)